MIQTSKAFYLLFILLLLKGMQINIKHIYIKPNQQLLAINKWNTFDDWTTIRHRWYWNRLNVDMQDWSEFCYRIQPSVQYYAILFCARFNFRLLDGGVICVSFSAFHLLIGGGEMSRLHEIHKGLYRSFHQIRLWFCGALCCCCIINRTTFIWFSPYSVGWSRPNWGSLVIYAFV